jgi:hypothetical protein
LGRQLKCLLKTLTSENGHSLQGLCRRAGCEVRFDPKTDLIPIPTPVAACMLSTLNRRRPSRFIRLPRPTE